MTTRFTALTLLLLMMPNSAFAADKLRGDVFCFPAKGVPQMVERLEAIDAKRTNIVDVNLEPRFIIKDGGDWPERFFLRSEETEIDIPVEKPSGATPSFITAVKTHPKTDICVADKSRAARPENDEGLYFEMGLSPFFHNTSGTHDMAELKEGTEDGKRFYKKMIPAAVRMFMPDTDYLAVKYDDLRVTDAKVFARVEGQDIPLVPEVFKEMHVISFKELKNMKASALIVRGGAYNLQPTVSVKIMKRFGWGQEEDKE